jgi:16S rRNA A1518/A1519 N6-dimethyltransferase RsmA/KsgA/DIM1 with predicted DNA glycosylase/AP lyase activity
MFLFFSGLVLVFGFVLLFGAPYLPTQRKQSEIALDLLDLKKGQTLFEFGCGDGRVLKLAAKRGLNVVGYELNPVLALIARINTLRYSKRVKVVWGDFWRADLENADGVYVFLIERFMLKLHKKFQEEPSQPIKLVSYAFKIPDKKPLRSKKGMYLYKY